MTLEPLRQAAPLWWWVEVPSAHNQCQSRRQAQGCPCVLHLAIPIVSLPCQVVVDNVGIFELGIAEHSRPLVLRFVRDGTLLALSLIMKGPLPQTPPAKAARFRPLLREQALPLRLHPPL